MSTCSGSSRRMAIRSGNRLRMLMTSLRGSCNAAITAKPHGPALSGQGREGGLHPVAELPVREVGGEEGNLIDEDHDERVLGAGGVLAVLPGERRGPCL